MKHAAHKAENSTNGRLGVSVNHLSTKHGSHKAGAGSYTQDVSAAVSVFGIDSTVIERINELAPQTRRSLRLASRAAQRRSTLIVSGSLAALVGTAATVMAFANPNQTIHAADTQVTTTTQLKRVDASGVSRSEQRASLSGTGATQQTSNNGHWQLPDSGSTLDVSKMSRSGANNPQVAALLDSDQNAIPQGFNPNHPTGDSGQAYDFSQCTWWVYVRRHQLGLPVGSHMGNGNMWANSALALGYWVDSAPRHQGDIMVFASGQDGSDPLYGHVAIVEKINADGSIVTSECGASFNGKTFSRTFTAAQAKTHQFIHY